MSVVHIPELPFYSAYKRRIAEEKTCGCKTCVDNKLLGIALEEAEAGEVPTHDDLVRAFGPVEGSDDADVPDFDELSRRFRRVMARGPEGGKKRKSRKGRKSRKHKKTRKHKKARRTKHRRSRRR